jgi:hypothetical protein
MEALNVVENLGSHFIVRAIAAMMDSFTLEHSEEPFASRIVTAVANCTHGTNQHIALQESLIITTPELTASI